MNKQIAYIVILFLLSISILSGCVDNTTPSDNSTPSNHFDSRLFGTWRGTDTITFNEDGTFEVLEGELSNWSVDSEGQLWMSGTPHPYELSENNTVLNIITDSYAQTFHKI